MPPAASANFQIIKPSTESLEFRIIGGKKKRFGWKSKSEVYSGFLQPAAPLRTFISVLWMDADFSSVMDIFSHYSTLSR